MQRIISLTADKLRQLDQNFNYTVRYALSTKEWTQAPKVRYFEVEESDLI